MANVREREKIAREIEKTSESIRKKHRALKTGRIEEGIALDILNLLSSRCNFSSTAPACALQKESRATTASKRERKEEEEQEKEGEEANEMFERSTTLHKSNDRSHDHVQPITFTPRAKIIPMIELLENVFGTTKNSLSTKFKISCKRRKMRYELAWARWGKRWFGNKRFDMDDADNIIIDGVRYAGTPGLYELIFKRIPDDILYTEDDMS
ncbi:hypothetical protein G5I_04855 [Acromyrmex echinatior]|uniref:DUF8207 domain-containing protein n=1 Tax=Acromyrmex echinatior TaxID=103372 RepID=F4WGR0_ACREC|nr:hypothetical protein G5I_04855 [Acromyrmex echinatior]